MSPTGGTRDSQPATGPCGDVVRSHGERLIADFLFLNGVTYEYERPYVHDVADARHCQYRPDFYYPDIDVWHEHWALDRDGEPPDGIPGLQGGDGLEAPSTPSTDDADRDLLGRSPLRGRPHYRLDGRTHPAWGGPRLEPRPPRTTNGRDPCATGLPRPHLHEPREVQLLDEGLELASAATWRTSWFRTRLFLDLYWAVADEWEQRLNDEQAVDFEDMLVQAADHLKPGR